MTQKRRGLGKGLGALIPTGPDEERPVNVFFPAAAGGDGDAETAKAATDDVGAERPEGARGSRKGQSSEAAAGRVDGEAAGAAKAQESGEPHAASSVPPRTSVDAVPGGGAKGGAAEKISGKTVLTAEQHGERPTTTAGESAVDGSAGREPRVADEAPRRKVGAVVVEPASSSGAADVSRETGAATVDVSSGTRGTRTTDTELLPVPGARFAELAIDAIQPNAKQPRTVFDEADLGELVGSIKEVGILQPVVVRPLGDAGQYELIMGERRLRAAKEAELDRIPAIIRDTDDSDMLRDALLENLHRTNLNPLEEAAAYQQLLEDFGCTHEELADRIARSRPQISNTLRLLKLPPLVQRRVAAGVLSAGHARALLGLEDGPAMERLAQRIVAEGLSVRATEEIVALGVPAEKKRRQPRPGQRSAAVDELAARLSDRFETRVRVNLGKNKGRLTMEFASVEDLNRILDILAPSDPGLLRS